MHFPSESCLDTVIAFSNMPSEPEHNEICRQFLADEIGAYEYASLALSYLNKHHHSDCTLHDGPAEIPKSCSCGVHLQMTPQRYGSEFPCAANHQEG